MTTVSYIHGPGTPAEGPAEFINYGALTRGELKLALAKEQASLLADYYGDRKLKEGAIVLDNVLRSGVHQGIQLPAGAPDFVRNAIAQAKGKTDPASGFFTTDRNQVQPVGINAIPERNCTLTRLPNESRAHWNMRIRQCQEKNQDINLLNTYLEKTAHHLLYEFNTTPGITPTVGAKTVLHRNWTSSMSELFAFDRNDYRQWLRNGVIRYNVNAGLPAIQPEDTCQGWFEGTAAYPAVGEPLTIAAITGLITVISAAAGATATLINQLKADRQNRIRGAAQGIGIKESGPEFEDAKRDDTTTETTPQAAAALDIDPMLLLAAGAGVLLLTSK